MKSTGGGRLFGSTHFASSGPISFDIVLWYGKLPRCLLKGFRRERFIHYKSMHTHRRRQRFYRRSQECVEDKLSWLTWDCRERTCSSAIMSARLMMVAGRPGIDLRSESMTVTRDEETKLEVGSFLLCLSVCTSRNPTRKSVMVAIAMASMTATSETLEPNARLNRPLESN